MVIVMYLYSKVDMNIRRLERKYTTSEVVPKEMDGSDTIYILVDFVTVVE